MAISKHLNVPALLGEAADMILKQHPNYDKMPKPVRWLLRRLRETQGLLGDGEPIKSRHIDRVSVEDPDLKSPVYLEIRKLATGHYVAIDHHYIGCGERKKFNSPYDPDREVMLTDPSDPELYP